MAKRYVRGDRAFGRLLKQLPEEVTKEIRGQLHQTGKMVLALAQRRVPVRTGALRSGLSYRVPPVRLSLKVGLIGKPINRKLFYGRIVEFGRKEQIVTATRKGTYGRALAAKIGVRPGNYKSAALLHGISGAYQMHVRALPPRHFVHVATKDQIYAPYRAIWSNALKTAASGAGDD